MHHGPFDASQLPHLQDRTFVVTGANSGLGRETCRMLGGAGADVVMACRNEAKAHEAIDDIRTDSPRARLEFLPLDLANLASIERFADQLLARRPRIDVLINNAGIMAIPRTLTADGFEMQLGTNHLGHFALTGRLLPRLLESPRARVVTVTSGAHHFGRMDFDDLMRERDYRKWRAYAQSKLANLLFTFELDRKVRAAGRTLISAAAHPGYAATNLQHVGPRMTGGKLASWSMHLANRWIAQDAEMGALPTVYAAVADDVRGGDFIGPGGFREMRGHPKHVRAKRRAYDEDTAKRLWEVSSELTGVTFPGLGDGPA